MVGVHRNILGEDGGAILPCMLLEEIVIIRRTAKDSSREQKMNELIVKNVQDLKNIISTFPAVIKNKNRERFINFLRSSLYVAAWVVVIFGATKLGGWRAGILIGGFTLAILGMHYYNLNKKQEGRKNKIPTFSMSIDSNVWSLYTRDYSCFCYDCISENYGECID